MPAKAPGLRGPFSRAPRRSIPLVAPGPSSKPSVGTARAAAAAQHERTVAAIVELDLDKCQNSYGVAPCTASGATPCYNTFGTCQDKPNYKRGTYTWRFCSRGMPLPPGEAAMRPYVESLDIAPAEIDPAKALASRSKTSITMVDEPDADTEGDPYNRAAPIATVSGNYESNLWVAGTGAPAGYTLNQDIAGESTFGNRLGPYGANEVVNLCQSLDTPVGDPGPDGGWTMDAHLIGINKAQSYLFACFFKRLSTGTITGASAYWGLHTDSASDVLDLVGTSNVNPYFIGAALPVFMPNADQWYLAIGFVHENGYGTTDTNISGVYDLNGVRIAVGLEYKWPADAKLCGHRAYHYYNTTISGEVQQMARPMVIPCSVTQAPFVIRRLCAGRLGGQAPQGTFWRRLAARTKNYAGRYARVRRGFVQSPWSWDTFQTELYIIESISGPDSSGRFTVQLSDVLRLADKTQLPSATDGKLLAQLDGVSNAGFAQGGGASTIQLAAAASQIDSTYVGEEVFILAGLGSGQRRVVSAYVGTTRQATVTVPWGTVPDVTSSYEVTPLLLTLDTGKGAQYPDPAVTGTLEYLKIGDEVLRYTKRSGDVLSWADGSYRAQFGTTRAQASANASVQLCRAWVGASASQVITDLLAAGGVASGYIDAVGLASEDQTWLGSAAAITACIVKPTKVGDLLKDLLLDLNMLVWWDPVAQLVRFRVGNAGSVDAVPVITDDNLIRQETETEVLDSERLTRAAIYFDLRSASANLTEARNFARASVYIDTDAESAQLYGDVRTDARYSRWLTSVNANYAGAVIARKIGRFRDAPVLFTCRLDPRDDVLLGDLRDLKSRALVDLTGAPQSVRVRVTKRVDRLTHLELEARTLAFGARYGFIAPAGYPDYDLASDVQRQSAFICGTSGVFSDGTSAYLIV